MTSIRWESAVLATMAGLSYPKFPQKIKAQVTPVFTSDSADLFSELLTELTTRHFVKYFSGHPIWVIENDALRQVGLEEELFWIELGTLWDKAFLQELWNYALTQPAAFDFSVPALNATLPAWCAVSWLEFLTMRKKRVREAIPEAAWSNPQNSVYGKSTPFYLRALIAEALAEPSFHNMTGMADWMNVFELWMNGDALSYEDGDFLRRILRDSL